MLALAFGWQVAIGYYALREAEQVLYRVIKSEPLHPLDHFMDVAAPAAAVGVLVFAQSL